VKLKVDDPDVGCIPIRAWRSWGRGGEAQEKVSSPINRNSKGDQAIGLARKGKLLQRPVVPSLRSLGGHWKRVQRGGQVAFLGSGGRQYRQRGGGVAEKFAESRHEIKGAPGETSSLELAKLTQSCVGPVRGGGAWVSRVMGKEN